MPLIYVTGISGAGKSTVAATLKARGYSAFDVDADGFKSWFRKASGVRATEQRAWADADLEWRRVYWLRVERAKVEELAARARDRGDVVFLCGTTPNDNDIWDLFARVIHLAVGEATLRRRLERRTDNDYGKHPDDLRDILGWNQVVDANMRGFGADVIDAEQPLESVLSDILSIARAEATGDGQPQPCGG